MSCSRHNRIHSVEPQVRAFSLSRPWPSFSQAVRETKPDASVLYVPPPTAADAIIEAIENEIGLIVCITEGIPQADEIRVRQSPFSFLFLWISLPYLYGRCSSLGRECVEKPIKVASRGSQLPRRHQSPRMQDGHPTWSHSQARPHRYAPESACAAPPFCCRSDRLHVRTGIVSRSGTLTYEAVAQTTDAGLGQSLCVGIGGDPFPGTQHVDVIKVLLEDDNTDGEAFA